MESKNSYFVLDMEESCVYMRYYPPVGGGESLKLDEVTDILDRNRIEGYNLKQIHDTIMAADKPVRFRISDFTALQYSESMDLKVTPDGMYAIVRFFPASDKGQRMSQTEIENDLKHYKIKFGVNENVIKKHLESPDYFRNIIIAAGVKPVQGTDAFVTYNFNPDRKAKPKLNEDGTVDFHQLDNINHVKKGEILAVLTPENPGVPGTNVYGVEVKPAKVTKIVLKAGPNTKVSEDGLQLISEVNGHVALDGDRVEVSNVYEVVADVDNSTGDIEYDGGVIVRGNVRTGFRIKAAKNVEVYGVVEGAEIEAGGDVILQRGIQGVNRCKITAGGNLISKFIESATVSVEGYVSAESILYSKVSAKGEINVSGKGGSIIGGVVKSTSLVAATSIGTGMGATTVVEVGTDPKTGERLKDIEKLVAEKEAELEKMNQLLTVFVKKQQMGRLEPHNVQKIGPIAENIKVIKQDIQNLNQEYEKKQELLSDNKNAKIRVDKYIHQGTKVVIAGDYIMIHDKATHCQFKKERGEIVSSVW